MNKFSLVALLAFSTQAFATPLLPQIQQTSREIGQNAQRQQQTAVDAANAGKAHLEDEAVRNAQKVKDALNAHSDQFKDDAKHDLVAGKQILVDELTCAVKNNVTNQSLSGAVRVDNKSVGNKLMLKIGSLLPDSPDFASRKNLAVSFRLAADDIGNYQYQIVDLDKPADSPDSVVHSVTLEQLGLDTDCSAHKTLVQMKDGLPQVNTDNLKQTVQDSSNVSKDVQAIEGELNKAAGKVQTAVH